MDYNPSKPLIKKRSVTSLSLAWLIVALQWTGFNHVASLLVVMSATVLTYAFVLKPRRLMPSWLQFQQGTMSSSNPLLKFGDASDELQKEIQMANRIMSQGNLAAAGNAFKKVSDMAETNHGQSHPLYFDAIRCRAQILFWQGYTWQAKELFSLAHDLATKEFGKDNPSRIMYIEFLSMACYECFELRMHLKYREEVVRIIESAEKNGRPCPFELSQAKIKLAMAYSLNGQREKALRLWKRTREPFEEEEGLRVNAIGAALEARCGHKEEVCKIVEKLQRKLDSRSAAAQNPAVTMMTVPYLMLANAELNRYGSEALDISQLEGHTNKFLEESLHAETFCGERAATTTVLKVLLIVFRIHQKKLSDSKRQLSQIINLMSKAEQPYIWTCYALKASILCWEKNHMEAEEHVVTAMRGHQAFFGRETAEYQNLNLLYGYILLARGQAARAKVALAEARRFFHTYPGTQQHHIIAQEQFALACICNGEFEEGRGALMQLLSEKEFQKQRFVSAKELALRSLSSLAAVSGNYEEAKILGQQASHETQSPASTHLDKNAAIGPLFNRWNMVWIHFELRDRGLAIQEIRMVHEGCVDILGEDHKITLSCRHDQLLLNPDEKTLEDLQKLLSDTSDILGTSHMLTMKIRKSISLHQSLADSNSVFDVLAYCERVYCIGNPANSRPQLAEIDWLNWSWNDPSHQKSVITNSLLVNDTRAFQPLPKHTDGATDSEWWEKITPNPVSRNTAESFSSLVVREGDAVMKPSTDVYTKLLLDFVRDFSPAFTETHYISSASVPLETIAPLGKGSYALDQVEKVRDPVTEQVYARKRLAYTRRMNPNETFRAEVNSMRKLSHEHIVKLCAAYVIPTEGIYALLMQPVADSNLAVYLEDTTIQPGVEQRHRTIISWLPCLANALHYMHSKKIRHQDIKPDNILVHGTNVRFTDFGIARDWATRYNSKSIGQALGAQKYQAPEVANGKRICSKADVFALGCVFVEMLNIAELHKSMADFRTFMFNDVEEGIYYLAVRKEEFHVRFDQSEIYQKVVKDMLHVDPEQRSTAGLVLTTMATSEYGDAGPLECHHLPQQTDRA
ncbi:kinase-like protein [Curvularia clavata]|uniref:Kinase-like protein n=1 Tax=Curvularia clavata TaxID=95742 RepID=A0A9Q8ZBB5_CURCL|nr:kinase-like protein [Curvularia clavata]